MSGWRALDDELHAWAGAGRRARLWWRDDDAAEDSPALARLLDLAGGAAPAPVLAVIPAGLSEAAAARIDADASAGPEWRIAQHGYAHSNHARENEKKIELGGSLSLHECIAQLRAGSALLSERFPKRFLPLLVPPWNRIAPALIPRLAGLGYVALSTYGGRAAAPPVSGLKRVNCHIDILDWRAGAAFLGEAETLRLACGQLAGRRRGGGDADEPIGLLSHHLRHDEAAWRFLAEFFARTAAHPGAHWIAPADLLAAA